MNRTNDAPYPDFWREVIIDSCGEVIDTGRRGYELHVHDVATGMNPSVCPGCSRKGDLHGVIGIVFRHCPRFNERLKEDSLDGPHVGLTDPSISRWSSARTELVLTSASQRSRSPKSL